jgi:sodium-dependent dicarboxylate transporter 2/3/5
MAAEEDRPEERAAWAEVLRGFVGDTRANSSRILKSYVLSPLAAFRKFLICLAVAAAVAWLPDWPGLEPAAQSALFVLIFAAALWISEAIPAYAVSVLVIALQIALLGRPGGGFAEGPDDWEIFIRPWADPLLWLFFGGFVMGAGAVKTGLDRQVAVRVLTRIPPRPGWILFAVMGVTMLFSMFMSNTATSVMMVAVLGPLLASLAKEDPFGRGLLLGVAFAASLGGMGTIIGSPPNAIAAGALGRDSITFAAWMGAGLPVALVLAAGVWTYLWLRYPSQQSRIDFEPLRRAAAEKAEVPAWHLVFVVLVFVVTVGLWLTGALHGIPSTVVSFLPITAFSVGRILEASDIRKLPWDVLLLLAGGLSLGVGIRETGLAGWIVDLVPLGHMPPLAVALVFAYLALWLSNFMSNTAAANILVPVAITFAGAGGGQTMLVVPIALAASAAMLLPISTPPNAIVYGQGRHSMKDFTAVGVMMGVAAPPLVVLWCWWYFL